MNDNCVWHEDEHGVYDTLCGNSFEFNEGAPCENGFLFCPYCGQQLKVLAYSDDDSDDS